MSFISRRWRRSLAVAGVSLLALGITHQLSYVYRDNLPFSNHSLETTKVISSCDQNTPQQYNHSALDIRSNTPNLIHQIWKTHDLSTYPVKSSHDDWVAEFEPMNYTVKLWIEDDILQLIKDKYPWLISTYETYPHNIQRADLARLLVVHAEGGIYADLDVYPNSAMEIRCLQNLSLQGIFPPTLGTRGLSNHFFMAEKGADFLYWALQEAKRRAGKTSKRILLPYLQVFWSTGPIMITDAFSQYSWMFDALDGRVGTLGDAYSGQVIRHEAGRSWHGWDGKLLNYLADHVLFIVLKWVVPALLVMVLALLALKLSRGWRFTPQRSISLDNK